MPSSSSCNAGEGLAEGVDHLTEHGVMPKDRLYESPFTDLAPHGPDGLLQSAEVEELIQVLDGVWAMAVAA